MSMEFIWGPGELVSDALLPNGRVQVAAARNTQLFEIILGTHTLRYGRPMEVDRNLRNSLRYFLIFTLLSRVTCWQQLLRSLVQWVVWEQESELRIPELTTVGTTP